jgi:hypothetical protein
MPMNAVDIVLTYSVEGRISREETAMCFAIPSNNKEQQKGSSML